MPERFKAEVISLGRITIPKIIRDLLNIDDGDFVEVQIRKIENNSLSPNEATLGPQDQSPLQASLEAPESLKEDS